MALVPADPYDLALLLGGGDTTKATAIKSWLGAGGTLGSVATLTTAQGSAYTQTYATADKTHAARTAAAAASPTATDLATALTLVNELKTVVNALRVDHLDTAQALNSVIDDLQALNLVL